MVLLKFVIGLKIVYRKLLGNICYPLSNFESYLERLSNYLVILDDCNINTQHNSFFMANIIMVSSCASKVLGSVFKYHLSLLL